MSRSNHWQRTVSLYFHPENNGSSFALSLDLVTNQVEYTCGDEPPKLLRDNGLSASFVLRVLIPLILVCKRGEPEGNWQRINEEQIHGCIRMPNGDIGLELIAPASFLGQECLATGLRRAA